MSELSPASKCPTCGAAMPDHAPQGLCPKCLLLGVAAPTETNSAEDCHRPPPPSLAAVAAAFPQLEILELVGQGGMGCVFKARQPQLNRLVALKILPESMSRDNTFATRFTREAQTLAVLSHPNIVTIHDFGQSGGFFYLLMEYVDGVNLRQALRGGHFTPEQALTIVPPLCDALQFAHERGVVHRDIKPENLLLDKEGRIKIADFGIAKLMGVEATSSFVVPPSGGSDARDADRLKPGLQASPTGVMGTPRYMAPEQRENPRQADHRADIFSLGVVFYEMLTGELPAEALQPPSRKVHIDVRLDEIVLRALEKEPERRYQTASQMKVDVETVVTGSQPPPPERPPLRPSLTSAVMVGLAAGLLTLFGSILIIGQLPREYAGTARIMLREPDSTDPSARQSLNPIFLQTELEVIRSQRVLSNVVERLNLIERWGTRNMRGDSTQECLMLLNRQLEVRPIRNSKLCDVRFFSRDPHEAAEIANAIAMSYTEYSLVFREPNRAVIVDSAQAPFFPSRPNVHACFMVGAFLSLIIGLIPSGIMLAVAYSRRRRWS